VKERKIDSGERQREKGREAAESDRERRRKR
jgi:hypothetical protein